MFALTRNQLLSLFCQLSQHTTEIKLSTKIANQTRNRKSQNPHLIDRIEGGGAAGGDGGGKEQKINAAGIFEISHSTPMDLIE